jgi:hypothetical protein
MGAHVETRVIELRARGSGMARRIGSQRSRTIQFVAVLARIASPKGALSRSTKLFSCVAFILALQSTRFVSRAVGVRPGVKEKVQPPTPLAVSQSESSVASTFGLRRSWGPTEVVLTHKLTEWFGVSERD